MLNFRGWCAVVMPRVAVESSCPRLTAASVPSGPEIAAVAPWKPAPPAPPHANSSNLFMYDPPLQTPEDILAFRQIIHANQFPSDPARCNRTLILYDDATTAGLGYTARLLGRALLVAINERRVLINAPHPTARWCGRAPYTLACMYEPWTHCPIPGNLSGAGKWSHRMAYKDASEPAKGSKGKGKGKGKGGAGQVSKRDARPEALDMVRISTSQIFKETFFYKFHQPSVGEASLYELLFRPVRHPNTPPSPREPSLAPSLTPTLPHTPATTLSLRHASPTHPPCPRHLPSMVHAQRAWVRDAARCVMRANGLHGGNFVVVHVRISEEKNRERGKQMPPFASYPAAADAAMAAANVSRVFLQTATPSALESMTVWAAKGGTHLSYTQSDRAEHDLWMIQNRNESGCIGNYSRAKSCRTQAGERSSVVAQAVNALIASRSRVFVSPTASMWTMFIGGLMRRRRSDAVVSHPSAADKRLQEIHRKGGARTVPKGQEDAAGYSDF